MRAAQLTCGAANLELDLALCGHPVESSAGIRLDKLARAMRNPKRRLEALVCMHFFDMVREGGLGGSLEKGLGGVFPMVDAAAFFGDSPEE